jgi:hypothetical protein
MSTRIFCDLCDVELSAQKYHKRLATELDGFRAEVFLRAEVVTGSAHGINDAHLCHPCVRRLVAEGKPTKTFMS